MEEEECQEMKRWSGIPSDWKTVS